MGTACQVHPTAGGSGANGKYTGDIDTTIVDRITDGKVLHMKGCYGDGNNILM